MMDQISDEWLGMKKCCGVDIGLNNKQMVTIHLEEHENWIMIMVQCWYMMMQISDVWLLGVDIDHNANEW